MTSLLRQINDAARCAERAAARCQQAEAAQRDDHLLVSDWQDVAGMLAFAAKPLIDQTLPDRWFWSTTAINTCATAACLTGALLWIPDPQRPVVLAVIVVVSMVAAAIAQQAAAVAWTALRGAAGIEAWDPAVAIADLRSRIAAIRVSLATGVSDPDLQAGKRIEWAEACLDRLERRVTGNARRAEQRPQGQTIQLDLSRTESGAG